MTSLARLQAVLSLTDTASPGLMSATASTNQLRATMGTASVSADVLGTSLTRTGARAQASSQAFRQAVPSLATFGSSMASLLITTGALDSQTGRLVTGSLAFASATASALPAIRALNSSLRVTAFLEGLILAIRSRGLALPLIAGAGIATAGIVGAGVGAAVASGGDGRARGPQVTINAPNATIRSEQDLNDMSQRVIRATRFMLMGQGL